MRKLLLISAVIAVATCGAHALPPKPYFGIYADASHLIQSVTPAVYSQFSVWFWCLPSENGLQAIEFHVTYPSNVVVLSSVKNPGTIVALGCPYTYEPGFCAIFPEGSCQMDWVWTINLTCMVLTNQPGFIEVGPLSYQSVLEAATCQSGYPIEPVTILDKFGINQEAVIGVEPETWGGIKSLYR
jgi:hypothetical protein